MDDLTGKLAEMLQDPETMKQIQDLAGMLGQGNSSGDSSPSAPPPSSPGQQVSGSSNGQPAISPEAMGMVMKLMPLLSSINQENDNTRFLKALRPLLGKERQHRLDEAMRLLQLTSLLPLLKQQGLFNS